MITQDLYQVLRFRNSEYFYEVEHNKPQELVAYEYIPMGVALLYERMDNCSRAVMHAIVTS